MLVLNFIADVKRLCNSAACKHPADYLSVLSPCPYIASKTDMLCNIFGKFIYFCIVFGVICQSCITVCLCICYAIEYAREFEEACNVDDDELTAFDYERLILSKFSQNEHAIASHANHGIVFS